MIINLKKKLMGKSARKPCNYNAKPLITTLNLSVTNCDLQCKD